MRTIVFHGDADNIVNPSNATDQLESRAGESIERARARQAGTHGYTRTVTRVRRQPRWHLHRSAGPDASKEMVRFFLEEQPVLPVLDD